MSVAALTWAFGIDIKPSSLKFVLVALADNADDYGLAFPSIPAIAAKTSQDRKTVQAALATLERRGIIRDTHERVGRTRQVKVFEIVGFVLYLKSKPPTSGTVSKNIRPLRPPEGEGAEISESSTENGTVPTELERSAGANGPGNGAVPESSNDPENGNDPESGTVPFFPGKDPVFGRKGPVFPGKGSQKRDTEPSGNRQKEPSGNHTDARAREATEPEVPRGTRSAFRIALTRIRSTYPAGCYREADWVLAEREIGQRVEEGVPLAELVAAAANYALQQEAKRAIGTQFVLSPAKFFGALGIWRGPFPIPRAASALDPQAREAWDRLLASEGAERDAPSQAALDAIGGWQRVRLRREGETERLRAEFCAAYTEALERAA